MTGPGNGILRAAWGLLLGGLLVGLGVLSGRAQEPAPSARQRIRELRTEIARHDELYFKKAAPEITDAECDALKRELRAFGQAQPEAGTGEVHIGDDRSGRFPTRPRRVRMPAWTKPTPRRNGGRSMRSWRSRAGGPTSDSSSNRNTAVWPSASPMHTACWCARSRAATAPRETTSRPNVRAITGLPDRMKGAGIPDLAELRGEIYCDSAEFTRRKRRPARARGQSSPKRRGWA